VTRAPQWTSFVFQDWKANAVGGLSARGALITYRLGHLLYRSDLPGPLAVPLRALYHLLSIVFFRVLGPGLIEPLARIGPGIVLLHGVDCVYVHKNARLGADVTLYQEVTIGENAPDGTSAAPAVGSGVVVYAGAKIIGDVTIGEDAVIGANAVVFRDIPAGATAVGNPAQVVKVDPTGQTARAERAQRTASQSHPRMSDPGRTA
jgi:serine O-acetyltransferase